MDNNAFILCAHILQYAFFAEHTQDRQFSEVKEALRFFFTDEEIDAAVAAITGNPCIENRTWCEGPEGTQRCLPCEQSLKNKNNDETQEAKEKI